MAPETAYSHHGMSPLDDLVDLIALTPTGARTTEDIFTGRSHPMYSGRVFGGQVLAQSVVAAARTVPDERPIHSLHGYFLRPGDTGESITYAVDRLRDGRSFTSRRTQAFQQGAPIFSMIASFQASAEGLEHAAAMPDVPGPETLPDLRTVSGAASALTRPFSVFPLDVRHLEGSLYGPFPGQPQPTQHVWMRIDGRLPDAPLVHQAGLAYLSDMSIQDSVLRAHGLAWGMPGLSVASLDHGMWWHRPARVDEWLLYAQSSPTAQGGRGLATGRFFTRDGALVATVSQEIMIRVPTDATE